MGDCIESSNLTAIYANTFSERFEALTIALSLGKKVLMEYPIVGSIMEASILYKKIEKYTASNSNLKILQVIKLLLYY